MNTPDEIAKALQAESLATVAAMQERLAKVVSRKGARGSFRANYIATGNLFRSLSAETVTQPGRVVNTITGSEYWPFVDKGRGPGGMPPIAAIQRWQAAKGGNVARASAYAIARTIAQRGTAMPASLFATDAIAAESPRLNTALGVATDLWLARVADNALNSLATKP